MTRHACVLATWLVVGFVAVHAGVLCGYAAWTVAHEVPAESVLGVVP